MRIDDASSLSTSDEQANHGMLVLQQQPNLHSGSLAPPTENLIPQTNASHQRENMQRQAQITSGTAQETSEYDPVTPLPATQIPSAPRRQRSRKERQLIPLVVAVSFLAIASAALLPLLSVQSGPSPLTVRSHQDRRNPSSVGQVSFLDSGQLDPNSNTGLNDIISLSLASLKEPHTGMSLYAWLLSDKTQDTIASILLGKLQVVSGKVQLSYQHPQHADLLVDYSRFLITEQPSSVPPESPSLDEKTWRYQGSFPDVPTPGDEQGYSLLSHLRHLLAKEPALTSLGLSGGLDVWFYRNTGKIFEWSNAARDDWAGDNTDLLRRQVDRVVQYLDGEGYAWRDLPANTPWLVDPKAGRSGIIDFGATPQQEPGSYISHMRLHMLGMVNAPGCTDAQKQLASKIDTALIQVEMALKQTRKDAVQLAKMSDTQLKGQDALTLLNDMQVNASNAYIGQTGGTTGVVWIHDTVQQLAQMTITMATPSDAGKP